MFAFAEAKRRIDGPKPNDEIAKIAARLEPQFRRAFLQAVAGLGAGVAVKRLEAALASGNANAALALLPFNEFEVDLRTALMPAMQDAMKDAGQYAGAKLKLRFDLTNPRAVEWTQNHAASLVKGIGDESRLAIRTIITEGYRDGNTPYKMAKEIRAHIGLTDRQARAVLNYQRSLVEQGVKDSRIDELAGKYSNRLLRQRANLIAVQESKVAAHAGQMESWRQATGNGLLDPAKTRKKWLASLNPCAAICDPLVGEEVGLDEDFDGIDTPPAHVGCNCSVGLVFS